MDNWSLILLLIDQRRKLHNSQKEIAKDISAFDRTIGIFKRYNRSLPIIREHNGKLV